MQVTLFSHAQRFVGIRELGAKDHPLISWWLSLCGFSTDTPDETPWCSAFLNGMAWDLRLPRSKSALARSWLNVGHGIPLAEAKAAYDVVIFWRGDPTATTGHVGLYAGRDPQGEILVLGGNQADSVSIAAYPDERLLGVRRIVEEPA